MAEESDYLAIYRPRKPYEAEPFDSSAVDYSKFSVMVTRILSTFDQGIVLALDAPWGHGKSFFARNFSAQLRKAGWSTAYVDAFAHDYIEDPFLLIVSTIIADIATPRQKPDLVNAASNVGKALLPIIAKAAVKIGTLATVDAEDLEEVKKAVTDAGGEAAEKLVKKRIEDFEKERAGVENFRTQLAQTAEQVKRRSGQPLVVFIDELDRCQPMFAVRTPERIKHFFDVPYLSFVLLLNQKQMRSAVLGVYGPYIDADTYLRKFIQFEIPLPQRQGSRGNIKANVSSYVEYLAGKTALGEQGAFLQPFVGAMRVLAEMFSFSMRDVEKAFTLFIAASVGRNFAPQLVDFLAFVIALRVAAPEVYQDVVEKNAEGYTKAINRIELAKQKGMREHLARIYADMLAAHVRGRDKLAGDSPLHRILTSFDLEPQDIFPFFSEMLDQVSTR